MNIKRKILQLKKQDSIKRITQATPTVIPKANKFKELEEMEMENKLKFKIKYLEDLYTKWIIK